MNYVTSAIFEGSWAKRLHAKGQHTLTFEPGVNILIGPNGSGKSSVVQGIIKSPTTENVTVKRKTKARLSFRSFDFEKENPRVTSINTQSTAAAFSMGLNSRFSSHGEVMRLMQTFLADAQVENILMLLDEPEQALDIQGMTDLIQLLTDTKASQVIIATHAPELVLHQSFHVIELKKGYRNKVRKHIKGLVS